MRHAAHKAAKVSHAQFSLSKALFTANRGSHTAKAVRMAQLAEGGAVVGLAPEVVDKLNEVAPMSRRAMREAAKAASRKSALVTSASLAALVGTAATALAFSQQNASRLVLADDGTETSQIKRVSDGAASRSEGRTALKELASTSNNGGWQLGDTSASMDASLMSKSIADNPNVAVLMDQDSSALPANFNPNHATGDVGNAYEFSQFTWWVYVRRHQLGLPAGSHMGNGCQWADSARALGYWVDNTPRHVGDIIVFAAGQEGSDSYYGHVAIVEKINDDGSIVTSESGASLNGGTYSRTLTNVGDFQYIHYGVSLPTTVPLFL